jgi:hypothetical protein
VGAFRERYRATGLVIPADHAAHHLVRLVARRHLRVLDLRTERNLDVLRVDDQISTGQHPDVWEFLGGGFEGPRTATSYPVA